MSSIFHYTDAGGLVGILKSKCLFASDYRYLNDSTEVSLIKKHILPIFEAETTAITAKLVEEGFLSKDYYRELGNRASSLEAENLYRAFVRGFDAVSPFFVTSFCKPDAESEEYENGVLSQWRAYSRMGGFALEFDESGLDKKAKRELESYAYVGFRSDKVEYWDHENNSNAKAFEGVAGEMIRGIFEEVGKDVSKITGTKDIDMAAIEFAKTAPFLKHRAFYEEDEYRLAFVCVRSSKMSRGFKKPIKKIEIRQKADLLIPYIELFDGADLLSALKGLIVGPHAFQEKQAEAAKMLLEGEGLNVPARLSTIPYLF